MCLAVYLLSLSNVAALELYSGGLRAPISFSFFSIASRQMTGLYLLLRRHNRLLPHPLDLIIYWSFCRSTPYSFSYLQSRLMNKQLYCVIKTVKAWSCFPSLAKNRTQEWWWTSCTLTELQQMESESVWRVACRSWPALHLTCWCSWCKRIWFDFHIGHRIEATWICCESRNGLNAGAVAFCIASQLQGHHVPVSFYYSYYNTHNIHALLHRNTVTKQMKQTDFLRNA